ncbi:RND efflux system, membrane fusion protein CmeA [Methylophaga lonarensis MPL]|uniref:RND efflux system, membrane fusion protein CmeA n=1 Tax=Methylophaga lonarensis MPL TaxID=1286106 RepID=M7PSZ0_9GAMM|nr:efflux RND transporter periplasmic adaptor subunit [Methylophaga lonarensis]EMR13584.1 RND efflux system, membrane fusion protein CmeA [Methylophaga lonarensis MPL]
MQFSGFIRKNKLMTVAFTSFLLMSLSGCLPSNADSEASSDSAAEAPPTAVEVYVVEKQTVTLTTTLPGRTVAFRKAEVRPQVSGIIEQRLFEEGAEVEAGQQLYQIEPETYQAAVQTARAYLSRAQANLVTTEAREERYRVLLADRAISQQAYDDALSEYEQAKAEVAVRKAELETAEINLRYTRVNAPISGQIGKSNFTEGALVSANQAEVLATIHQLDPIYVDVSQASKELITLRQQIMQGLVRQEGSIQVSLELENGTEYPHQGELQFSEVNVNENTGSVMMRALMPNPEQLLLPGMFVRTTFYEGERDNAILIPHRAVQFDRQGNASVMLVNADNEIEIRPVITERSLGNRWLLGNGLEEGERIVIAGQQKVGPGAKVSIAEKQKD